MTGQSACLLYASYDNLDDEIEPYTSILRNTYSSEVPSKLQLRTPGRYLITFSYRQAALPYNVNNHAKIFSIRCENMGCF